MTQDREPSVKEIYTILQYLAQKIPSGQHKQYVSGTTVNEIRVKGFTKEKKYTDVKDSVEFLDGGGLVEILGKGGVGTLYIITSEGLKFYDELRRVMSQYTSIIEKRQSKQSE